MDSTERQKYQLHKNGYEDMVKAIKELPKLTDVKVENLNLDLTETNSLLYEVLNKLDEPICLKLELV